MRRALIVICLLFSSQIFAEITSNYAGQQIREIKSLSQSEVEGYRAGNGMGLAKPAELNGYPGPRHVLDLSDRLKLTPDQLSKSNTLFDSMQSEAKTWGAKLVNLERQLDQMFADEKADQAALKKVLFEIADVQAQIRYSHLVAHIEQKKILTRDQIALYEQYRGYDSEHSEHSQHSQHDGHSQHSH